MALVAVGMANPIMNIVIINLCASAWTNEIQGYFRGMGELNWYCNKLFCWMNHNASL